jgi:hypothetical protein
MNAGEGRRAAPSPSYAPASSSQPLWINNDIAFETPRNTFAKFRNGDPMDVDADLLCLTTLGLAVLASMDLSLDHLQAGQCLHPYPLE